MSKQSELDDTPAAGDNLQFPTVGVPRVHLSIFIFDNEADKSKFESTNINVNREI